jgi:hypothetical protein
VSKIFTAGFELIAFFFLSSVRASIKGQKKLGMCLEVHTPKTIENDCTENRIMKNLKKSTLAFAIAAYVSGCGSATPPAANSGAQTPQTAAQPTGNCSANQYALGALCISASNFTDACRIANGRMITVSGAQACQVEYSALWSYGGSFNHSMNGSGFPILLENQPNSSTAWSTGVPVYAGDKIIWSAGGGWGKATTSGTIFTWTTVNCTDVSLNGVDDGVQLMNSTLPKGLLGSDGTHVFLLGTSSTNQIQSNGSFSFGFNIPNADYRYCSSLAVSQATIRHCEDSSRRTYPCP